MEQHQSSTPVFICQFCRAKLTLTGSYEHDTAADDKPSTSTAFDTVKIDESFIVLDDKRPGGTNRALEESFVVLGSASLLKPQQAQTAQPQQQSSDGSSFGLDAKLQALAQLFEMASTQTQVDQPLCLDCAAQLKDEVEAQIQEAEREIAAYSAAVARLEAESAKAKPLSPGAFQVEIRRLQEEEEQERHRSELLEAQIASVSKELQGLQSAAADMDALEERYWHDYNDYQLQLQAHIEERDGLLNRIDRTSQRLQLLRNTNVYNDAFKIWHDGPFGTISSFRLGRTPEVAVEWDEINAAWGQAVLLLHTMSQACKLHFTSARLLPMGSHPRVADKRTQYDLFGPVSKLWSQSYDRAMVYFLACLKEFGEHARSRDAAEGKEAPFTFPFLIEGDKVNNHTIKLSLNKDVKWTKALKFMLADLKVALQWMVKRELDDSPQLPALGPEGPAG